MRTIVIQFIVIVIGISYVHGNQPQWSQYRTIIASYEHQCLDGQYSIRELQASVVSEFHGLAQPYSLMLLESTAGPLFSTQLEEIFPSHAHNTFIYHEFIRRLEKALPTIAIDPQLPEFIAALKQKGIRFKIYSTLPLDLVKQHALQNGLQMDWVEITMQTPQSPIYPPLEKIRQGLALPRKKVLATGTTQYDCTNAGIAGIDFVAFKATQPIENRTPCTIQRNLNSFQDLLKLVIQNR